ncbi:MAG TPA: 2-phospho-L-lactate guanylyltransferase [Terriglobales bacterium]|nr:2-phospho-L-lactate guanylyltransferase [Terriglobales bacterium]
MILVPVKNFANAKQRLSAALDAAERTALARAMFEDVLAALAGCSSKPEVSVVSGDAYAQEVARALGFSIIEDGENRSETDAIAMASAICESQGVKSVMVLPSDIPLITSAEIEMALARAPGEGTLLVPAGDGRGTNAIRKSPVSLFPLRFGNDSFLPHLAAARATGKPVVIVELPGIALDVDRPHDLGQLLATSGRTRAQRLLAQWNVLDRLQPISQTPPAHA